MHLLTPSISCITAFRVFFNTHFSPYFQWTAKAGLKWSQKSICTHTHILKHTHFALSGKCYGPSAIIGLWVGSECVCLISLPLSFPPLSYPPTNAHLHTLTLISFQTLVLVLIFLFFLSAFLLTVVLHSHFLRMLSHFISSSLLSPYIFVVPGSISRLILMLVESCWHSVVWVQTHMHPRPVMQIVDSAKSLLVSGPFGILVRLKLLMLCMCVLCVYFFTLP